MCIPSRSDQIATSAATSHCRALGAAPATGHSALPAPTRPTEKVQMVSTQPELPVRCCTIQATAIRTDSDSAMRGQRLKIQNNHAKSHEMRGEESSICKIRSQAKPGFTPKFP